jgi:hypothetical protein
MEKPSGTIANFTATYRGQAFIAWIFAERRTGF